MVVMAVPSTGMAVKVVFLYLPGKMSKKMQAFHHGRAEGPREVKQHKTGR